MANKKKKKKKSGFKPNKRLSEIRQAARNGNPDAMVFMGISYISGKDVTYNPQRAYDYFKKAAAAGNKEGLYNLGMLYLHGEGCNKDYDQARFYLKQAINLGHEQAKQSLSYLDTLVGQEKNDQREFVETKEKADQGDESAQVKLSEYYIYGIGTDTNIDQGINLLKKLADQNNAEAIIALSDLYHDENFVLHNEKDALHYDQMGAAVGIASCLHNVAAYHINHDDFNAGFALLKEAAANDSPISNFMCAYYYYEGKYVKTDKNEVFRYLKRSLELKYEQSFELIDYLFEENYFTYEQSLALARAALVRDQLIDYDRLAALLFKKQETYAEAMEVLKKAADKGDSEAENIFKTLSKNLDNPEKALIDQAERGNDQDAYQLAMLYRGGIIVPADSTKCVHWLSIAVDRGSTDALAYLGEMYVTGTGTKEDTKKGLSLLEEAATFDNVHALNILEAMYRSGHGVPKNMKKANEYARAAEDLS